MPNKRARYGTTIGGERTGHLVHPVPRKSAIEKAKARKEAKLLKKKDLKVTQSP